MTRDTWIWSKARAGRANRILMLLLMSVTNCWSVAAQQPTPGDAAAETQPPPDFKPEPAEEDWSAMRDPAARRTFLDRIKYIPLRRRKEDWYLSIGGDVKPRHEFFNGENWGASRPSDPNGYVLQRYMLHLDFHLGHRWRTFVEVKSGVENNRRSAPRPIDENYFDLHQAFVEVGLGRAVKFRPTALGANATGEGAADAKVAAETEVPVLSLRAGRQELSFGASRLVSTREGTNVRLSFDALRATFRRGRARVDGFVAKPVEIDRAAFDEPHPDQTLWGVYAVRPVGFLPGDGKADVYYFGFDSKRARFDQGVGREIRHTVGTRLWGRRGDWEYNHEFILQAGKFGRGKILAGAVSYNIAYNLLKLPLRPRLSINGDVVSGDRRSSQSNLNTFNPLFPKNGYYGDLNLLTPANLIDVIPAIQFALTERLSVSLRSYFFWRQSPGDGVYSPGGALTKPSGLSQARFVGMQPLVELQYEADRHTTVTATYANFAPGRFIKETPPGENVSYFTAYLKFRF